MDENDCGLYFVEIMNLIFMALLTRSINWADFSAKRFAAVIFLWLVFLGLPLLLYKKNARVYKKAGIQLKKIREYLQTKKKKVFLVVLSAVCTCFVPWFLMKASALITGTAENELISLFIAFLLLIILAVVVYFKSDNGKPEQLFLAILLICGTTFIMMSPNMLGISWDDQVHYDNSESIVDFIDGYGLTVDNELQNNMSSTKLGYSKSDREKFNDQWNQIYKENEYAPPSKDFGVRSVAYIPYVIGAVIGRGLSLPFTGVFKLSKFFNLLFYGLIVSAAAKKIKNGKIAVLAIGLIPTTVFMAASFSYDPWVTAWTLYGFCYFLSFLQNREKQITDTDMFRMLGAFVIGFLPKAVYLVIMFPLFFMPSATFKSKKDHVKYVLLIIASGLLLIGSVGILMFFGQAGVGDPRGGSGVNAAEQLSFILNEPVAYGKILLSFLSEYLSITNASHYIVDYAYLGQGYFKGLSICVLFSTIMLDKNGENEKTLPVIIATLLGILAAVVIIPTSLYIDFTPVRFHTVNGCQYRYLIPLVFPFAYMFTPSKIINKMNQKLFCCVQFSLLSLLFVGNVLALMLPLY